MGVSSVAPAKFGTDLYAALRDKLTYLDDVPVMASPPVVGAFRGPFATMAAALAASNIAAVSAQPPVQIPFISVPTGAWYLNPAFSYLGPGPVIRVGPGGTVGGSGAMPGIPQPGFGSSTTPARAEELIYTNAGLVEFLFMQGSAAGNRPGHYRLNVNGQRVTRRSQVLPTDVAGPNIYILPVTFPSPGQYRISLEFTHISPFAGVQISSIDTVQPMVSPKVQLYALGDSFQDGPGTDAAAAPHSLDCWIATFCARLGIRNWFSDAIGGTGVIAVGSQTNYAGRLAATVAYALANPGVLNPDIIIFQGSTNDTGNTSAALSTAALAELLLLGQTFPNAYMIITGSLFTRIQAPSDAITIGMASAAANYFGTATMGKLFINAINGGNAVSTPGGATPAIYNWMSGSGFVGATTGIGTSDVMTGSDDQHPTIGPAGEAGGGADFIAEQCLSALMANL